MEDIFKSLIDSSPLSVAFLVVVYMFIKHLDKKDALQNKWFEETNKVHKEVSNAINESTKVSTDVIKENTKIIGAIQVSIENFNRDHSSK